MGLPELKDYIALDCEMVETQNNRSNQALAKIGVVDHSGAVILESFVYVHPSNVRNWRSSSSGIRPGDLDGAPTYEMIQKQVKELVKGKIIVGHAAFNDLAILQIRHPYEAVRDTALYYPLRELAGVTREGVFPSLKVLTEMVLGQHIQAENTDTPGQRKKGHDPVEDARATMAIFMTVREAYEASIARDEDVVASMPESFSKWYW